jgi:dynein heavy chain
LLVREQLDNSLIASADADADKVINFLEAQDKDLQALHERSDTLSQYQHVLKQPVAEFETMQEVLSDMALKKRLWSGVKEWADMSQSWVDAAFEEVDAVAMEKQISVYAKIGFQATKQLPGNPVGAKLKGEVDKYKPLMPVIVDLRNDALKPRHWDQIHAQLGFQIQGAEGLTLGSLIDMHVADHADEISGFAVAAQQEQVLEGMIAKVAKCWSACDYDLQPYKDQKDAYILGSTEDITTNLDDGLVTINTILGSRFVGPIRDQVEGWQHKLILFQETLDEWLMVQRNWMYLETIFSAPDIQRQLPDAAKKFFMIDKSFRDIMIRTNENPNALRASTSAGLHNTFVSHNEGLDKIQKNLEDYLETKRMAFPRFYFLSNDELLEILAQTKNVQAVQPHVRKCFECMTKLDFGDDPKSIDIFAMWSGEGERVSLGKNLKARGNVEDWLTNVEKFMRVSLHRFMKASYLDFDVRTQSTYIDLDTDQVGRCEWMLEGGWPSQCLATTVQMTWSRATEAALSHDNPDKELATWYQINLDDLQHLIGLIRGDLTKLTRNIIVAIITTDVHARDIIQELYEAKVDTVMNFEWQKCLRYYWDEEIDDIQVRHSDALVSYGYEYMGACSRLVITPLTDRCWMTITGSYGLKLGAAPAGPAGTGKTESSKDLAKALGIGCVVFNCSDQIDYKFMGKLFRGLAQMGGWTCLDEFNRIDIEVLSVIAQQMLTLREGRLNHKEHINFMGIDIVLRDHHVIITMNPGYAGRTELPDNLKVCFRPVSMMVPDYGLIAEIMLFAEGFGDAKTLSRKMCKLYILCSEQLSQQPHYDYGLRAVKSVLVMAGGLKRADPDVAEDVTLIRALRDSNQPKFLSFDLPLFAAIIQDLFPGVVVPDHDYGEFGLMMLAEIDAQGLQPNDKFQGKVRETFDIMNIRFGMCIVGPTGSGKTTNWKLLQTMMTNLRKNGSTNDQFQEVVAQVLNPKCIAMGELYGSFNEMTQEWHDGLAPTIMRKFVNMTENNKRWTVFDGPIDAIWIESMNTVLDDNMTLCLANGERIKLCFEMKMVFEVMDLAVASPATVSRIGIVYMTPEDLGWMPYVQSWLPREMGHLPEKVQATVMDLFEKLFGTSLAFMYKRCTEPIATVPVQMATSHCAVFTSLLGKPYADGKVDFAMPEEDLIKLVLKTWTFSLIWSVGISMFAAPDSNGSGGWEAFEDMLRELMSDAGINVGLPNAGQMYDYYVNFETKEWDKWESIITPFKYNPDLPYFQMMVATVDTVRFSYVAEHLLAMLKPIFFTGVTGTGKTVVLAHMLEHLSPLPDEGGMGVVPINVNFSAQTNSLITQAMIEAKMEKKRKTLLGAPVNRKMVIFVDDVNMPTVEEYGAQPPIELLRQFLDMSGFYDRDKLFWKDILDTTIISASAPPGGGRNEVTPRFSRHFNMLCMQPGDDKVLTRIFEAIFCGFLDELRFADELKQIRSGVVAATIELYHRISNELLPTPTKFHYTFNLRDISKVFQGMLMVRPKKCGTNDKLCRLWVHESQRIFYDRLATEDDQKWFESLAVELLGRHCSSSLGQEELFQQNEKMLLWGDFFKPGTDFENRVYEEASTIEKVVSLLDSYLEDYNMANANQMGLIFFEEAVKHAARISRTLRQPRGNLMLVGVGGSGKQSLTRLGAAIGDMPLSMIELSRGYGINELREDVKLMMIDAGVKGSQVVWLFTDSQIVEPSFLEDINNILNTGEVPNLFPDDEMAKIVNDIRPVVKAMGLPETRDNCVSTFVSRVRDFLHIVLCMSPVGDNLRVNCRQFPSLVNCTTIDWFMAWPATALKAVAENFLSEEHLSLDLPGINSDDLRAGIVSMCSEVHQSVRAIGEVFFEKMRRRTYTTPKSYLDLISVYTGMLAEKRGEISALQQKMITGVEKLDETESIVSSLQADLEKLKPVLKEKSAEADALLKQCAIDQASAAIVQTRVEADAAEVAVTAAEVHVVQEDAQRDLDKALPALNSAVKALNSLTKGDITEVKSFAQPPPAVKTVMEGVCIMLGSKPTWDDSKKLLGDSNFLDNLKNYDKDNIAPSVLKKIKPYILNEGMAVEVVKKVSKAATGLCMWIHAMDVYSSVAKEVGPKKEKLAAMNAKLQDANNILNGKQAELKAVIDKVAALQKLCDDTVAEKDELARQAQQCSDRLKRADKLTSGLASEGVRWRQKLIDLQLAQVQIIGDTFQSSAVISYSGPFTDTYRDMLITQWSERMVQLDIPYDRTSTSILRDTIGDPVTIRGWNLHGLPADRVSVDNGILVTKGARWPLMIDPQGQACTWVKNMESEHLEVTTMVDMNMLRSLENCIRVGKSLLIEDVHEHIDPALEPVLQKATFKNGGRLLIHLGDSDVDYDPAFRFFMTTKMPNPHYLPEVCIKVTVINFTVTMTGLTDQLLGMVVKQERPDVEAKNVKLMLSMAADQKKLVEIEDNILKMLSESTGNILDDAVLISTLADSKVTSDIIQERVAEAVKTKEEIEETRRSYKKVSVRASLIYFVIADMGNIDPMYQYSLDYYAALFIQCMLTAEEVPSTDLAKRTARIIEFTTENMYCNICRGLFEKDKPLYAALMAVSIGKNSGHIQECEWNMLMRGAGPQERAEQIANPDHKLISDFGWDILTATGTMIKIPADREGAAERADLLAAGGGKAEGDGDGDGEGAGEGDGDGGAAEEEYEFPMAGLAESIQENLAEWKVWINADDPINAPLACGWEDKLNTVQKMLVIKVSQATASAAVLSYQQPQSHHLPAVCQYQGLQTRPWH